MSTRPLQIFFVALALLANGCFGLKLPRPAVTSSAFFDQAQNFHQDIQRIVIEKGCTLSSSGSGVSSGSGSNGFSGNRNFYVELRGSKEAVDKVMLALKAELERLAKRHGATIGAAGENGAAESPLLGFHFDYTIGDALGHVSAKLEGGPESYQLSLGMQEKVP